MAQRKETKKTIKVRDLKPKKDAKGGVCTARSRTPVLSHQQSDNQVAKIRSRFKNRTVGSIP